MDELPAARFALLGPVLVNVAAWVALTATGAAIFNLAPDEFWAFLGAQAPSPNAVLGGQDYWLLLGLPVVTIPITAIVGWRGTRRFLMRAGVEGNFDGEVSARHLYLFTVFNAAYCIHGLATTGHALPGILSTGGDYAQNILARAQTIADLHFLFYAVLYAFIPIVSCLFFARWLHRKQWTDLLGLGLNSALFSYLVLAVYMKAPFMVFFAMLALTFIFTGARWRIHVPALAVVALLTFGSMQALIGVVAQGAEIGSTTRETSFLVELKYSFMRMPMSVAFRMATAYPFYLGIFDDPAERCGVETNYIPLLPKPTCDLPSKVFAQMYPSITNVVGMAPAAAHVSAYGELGLWWSIVVLVISGLSVGITAAIAALWRGPIGIALAVATCVYAYYLTQVPLLGALTYSHGLVFLLFPSLILILVNQTMRLSSVHRRFA